MLKPAAWTVINWPVVVATLQQFENAVPLMRPVSTTFHSGQGEPPRAHGTCLWASHIEGEPVGVAWDWAEVTTSVVAMVDPMRLLTNLVLLDAEGRILDDAMAALHLNRVIYEMPWQHEVLNAGRPLQRLAA